eukprot:scaffold7616_cov169-Cylindrotheca_fusiformis.AAC.1
MRIHSSWQKYAALRRKACTKSVAWLRYPRSDVAMARMSQGRALSHTMALLRFDFDYGDFIRWMGGEYTNRHRDWNAEWQYLLSLPCRDLPSGYPPPNYELAYRIQTEGVPLKGTYDTPMAATIEREQYDNHPAVQQNSEEVHKKFAKEEWKGYHVHFQRFVFVFIRGLILNPIQWVFDKGKGRICIDCTNGPVEEGSANYYIPKPSADNMEECPPVYYQSALNRLITRIMSMRVAKPETPILVHADDISSAFRRILYHPDMACAFAYVFDEFLLVPVGEVFGSRSAPSYYCVLADVRQALASILRPRLSVSHHPLVQQCQIQIQSDPMVPLTLVPSEHRYRQEDKWEDVVTEEFLYLGFIINTRSMTITWPQAKRERLRQELVDIMARDPHRRYVTPKEMAHIVGVVRSASQVAPWGNFLSFNLENALIAAERQAKQRDDDEPGRRWWQNCRIFLSKVAIGTIRQLLETLVGEPFEHLWRRPIALYLDRESTHTVISDASYLGLGGWSPDFLFLWRLTREDLVSHGFDMKAISLKSGEPDGDAPGLHINPLEFIATILNLWIALKCIQRDGPCVGGYVIGLLSDNTTALSWMSYTSRTRDPLLQGLARVASSLLVRATALLTKVVPSHIPGQDNTEADMLSRPWEVLPHLGGQKGIPSLVSVIDRCSRLQPCRICLLPSKLLQVLASTTSSLRIEATLEQITTELLMLELNFLPHGVLPGDLTSTIFEN